MLLQVSFYREELQGTTGDCHNLFYLNGKVSMRGPKIPIKRTLIPVCADLLSCGRCSFLLLSSTAKMATFFLDEPRMILAMPFQNHMWRSRATISLVSKGGCILSDGWHGTITLHSEREDHIGSQRVPSRIASFPLARRYFPLDVNWRGLMEVEMAGAFLDE